MEKITFANMEILSEVIDGKRYTCTKTFNDDKNIEEINCKYIGGNFQGYATWGDNGLLSSIKCVVHEGNRVVDIIDHKFMYDNNGAVTETIEHKDSSKHVRIYSKKGRLKQKITFSSHLNEMEVILLNKDKSYIEHFDNRYLLDLIEMKSNIAYNCIDMDIPTLGCIDVDVSTLEGKFISPNACYNIRDVDLSEYIDE